MAGLEECLAGQSDISVRNMSWSPIHIVQQFEDAGAPERIVLVGAASACDVAGRVSAWRWYGGLMSEADVQERVYEAVTGVVDLENTLMIGERFGIWPKECYTIEVEIPAATFGMMVMAEAEGVSGAALARGVGFDPWAALEKLAADAASIALHGYAAAVAVGSKRASDLLPVASFHRIRVAGAQTRREA